MSRSSDTGIASANDPVHARRLTLFTAFLFTFIVAQILGAELLYFMCATFLSLMIIAWVLGRASLRSVTVERFFPSQTREGETIHICFRVTLRGKLPRLFVSLQDTLPEWIVPADGRETHIVPILIPNRPVDIYQTVMAAKRGHYKVGPAVIVSNDPLGLFSAPSARSAPCEITVFPSTIPVRSVGSTPGGETGMNPYQSVNVKASGPDFHGVREYVPNDELRRIHWKSTAHHGTFSVIEFEDTWAADTTVLLDIDSETQGGEGLLSTLETGIKIAATLVEFAARHGVPVRLVADDERLPQPQFGWDAYHERHLMETLARMEAKENSSLSTLADEHRLWYSPGSCFVVISARASQELVAVCSMMARQGCATTCFLLDAAAFDQWAAPERKEQRAKGGPNRLNIPRRDSRAVAETATQLMDAGVNAKVIRPDTDLTNAIEGL